MTAKDTAVEKLAGGSEEPGVIQSRIVHDKVDDVRRVVVLVSRDQGAMNETTTVGIGEF